MKETALGQAMHTGRDDGAQAPGYVGIGSSPKSPAPGAPDSRPPHYKDPGPHGPEAGEEEASEPESEWFLLLRLGAR